MPYLRTKEHRKLRSKLIRKWKPWVKSSGPKSEEGKAKVAQNAFKGGVRPKIRQVSKMLREQREALNDIVNDLCK